MKLSLVLLASTAIFGVYDASAQEPGYVAPKTVWGAPDFTGVWNNASLTTVQRLAGASSVTVNEEEAQKLAKNNVTNLVAQDEAGRSKVDDASSKKLLSDKNSSRAYNRFWMDPGVVLMKVKGEYRTSYITDPPSGKIPFKDGKTMNGVYYNPLNFDAPEVRQLNERCVSYGKTGPIFQSTLYNNNIQMIQTPTHLMLMTEMIHEVRIIPIFKTAAEAKASHGAVSKWGGDSVSWYEGNTLVVETVNPHPLYRTYITSTGKSEERFTRWNNEEVLYEFKIDDPSIYTQVWSGEETFVATKDPLYEYACHEGNYSLPGILAGARQLERDGRVDPPVLGLFEGVGRGAEPDE